MSLYGDELNRLTAPQRSRRLSASGIALHEGVADSPGVPQRSRRLSASGIVLRVDGYDGVGVASKKQTPFSVWYSSLATEQQRLIERPQRSRRLSASGILFGADRIRDSEFASKKQTPFSVWYARHVADGIRRELTGLKEADAFQRLVSASRA